MRDAREDRLTEIWAAIFSSPHCRGFARYIALEWLRAAASDESVSDRERFDTLRDMLAAEDDWRCDVRTQVPVTAEQERRRPDLTLAFSGPRSTITLRIEVKHGTAPHGGQLDAYGKIQAHGHHAVLLIAPRADYPWFPPEELPATVPCLTWEQTAQDTRMYLADQSTDHVITRFLLNDLWTYMCEQGLTDPERLTSVHIQALQHYRGARAALERLGELASARLADTWGGDGLRGQHPTRGEPRQYWWRHQPEEVEALLSPDWWWDWKLVLNATDVIQNAEPRPAFIAGITGNPGALAQLPDAALDPLESLGFAVFGAQAAGRGWDYVVKHAYLDHDGLLTGTSLHEQACSLASWLEKAFRDLHAALRGAGIAS